MKEIEIMWQLQELDKEVTKIRTCARQNNKSLQKIAENLNVTLLEAELDACNEVRLRKQKELRIGELDLENGLSQQKEVEQKLYDGTILNNKELQKLQEKLTALQEKQHEEERNVYSIMEYLEQQREKQQQLTDLLAKKQDCWQAEKEKRKILTEKIRKRKVFLLQQRKALVDQLSAEWQEKYAVLQEKFKGTAIALLERNICQGCFLALSSSFQELVMNKTAIYTCENCRRILYQL